VAGRTIEQREHQLERVVQILARGQVSLQIRKTTARMRSTVERMRKTGERTLQIDERTTGR